VNLKQHYCSSALAMINTLCTNVKWLDQIECTVRIEFQKQEHLCNFTLSFKFIMRWFHIPLDSKSRLFCTLNLNNANNKVEILWLDTFLDYCGIFMSRKKCSSQSTLKSELRIDRLATKYLLIIDHKLLLASTISGIIRIELAFAASINWVYLPKRHVKVVIV